jgi:predicted membrane-bound spermidine synthase
MEEGSEAYRMSFKQFIYYCALCGGWAALVAWVIVQFGGLRTELADSDSTKLLKASVNAGLLGLMVGGMLALLDALQNSKGAQRFVRVLLCMVIGVIGSMLAAFLGQILYTALGEQSWCVVLGWVVMGVLIGASIGVFDLLRAIVSGQESSAPLRKTVNGVIGGFLGGLIGGLAYALMMTPKNHATMPRSDLLISFVLLGLCIGLLIGLAQVVLKDAWVRVEQGFRPGRELMLMKDETTIGRAEACDLGLFGDNGIERTHARILIRNNRYILADAGTPGGTYLNDERIDGPTPLRSGDRIRVGKSVIRFGERQKRR